MIETNGGQVILERAARLMEEGKLPDDVSEQLLWAGLVHLYQKSGKRDARIAKLESTVNNFRRVIYVAWGLITFVGGVIIKEVGSWIADILKGA